MRPVLMVYGQDVGGVRVLSPVVKRLIRERSFTLCVLGTPQAAEVFRSTGIACQALDSLGYRLPLAESTARQLLQSLGPALFLGGASYSGDPTNARLLEACKRLNIATVALLDHWKNLDRFDEPTTGDVRFAPDVLGVMDESTKGVLQAFGFDKERLYVVGHPYLQEVHGARRRLLKKNNVAALKQRIGIPADGLLLLCCSEMLHVHGILETCGSSCQPLFQVNVKGATVFDRIRYLARRVEGRSGRPCLVALRPHPFEENRRASPAYPAIPILDSSVCTDVEAVAAADVVVGMSSMPMIQAYVLGKPVVSLQSLGSIVSQDARPIRFHWDSARTFTVAHNFAELERVLKAVGRGHPPSRELTGGTRAVLRDATGRAVRLLKRVARQTCPDRNGNGTGAAAGGRPGQSPW